MVPHIAFSSGRRLKDGTKPVRRPVVNKGRVVGRNEYCPCGSGKKYKNCCWAKDQAKQ
ncbi:MAG: SEC-C domain-containing protein [Clostridia bacterium]|nr:SEC-C domain-containing protein [Clostridia bacterium]